MPNQLDPVIYHFREDISFVLEDSHGLSLGVHNNSVTFCDGQISSMTESEFTSWKPHSTNAIFGICIKVFTNKGVDE